MIAVAANPVFQRMPGFYLKQILKLGSKLFYKLSITAFQTHSFGCHKCDFGKQAIPVFPHQIPLLLWAKPEGIVPDIWIICHFVTLLLRLFSCDISIWSVADLSRNDFPQLSTFNSQLTRSVS